MHFNFIDQTPQMKGRHLVPLQAWKILLIMKLTLTLVLCLTFCASAEVLAQKVTIQGNKITLPEVLGSIQKQTGYAYICKRELLTMATPVDLNVKNTSVAQALKVFFNAQSGLTFNVKNDVIVVTAKKQALPSSPPLLVETVADTTITITGMITDEDGNPIAGVSVQNPAKSRGTTSGANGRYSITVADSEQRLVFSSIGFNREEVVIGNQQVVDVTMIAAVSELNQVVVTGYSSQRKKDLTGSVSVVNVDEMIKQPASQVTSQMQGQVSGLTVIGSGQPGEEPTVRIRGINSFGNNGPLYVIDGVPTQAIFDLNPNDIESMQVLKDAGAASIYGSRASNGVVIITTRKGRGGVKVDYSTYWGVQRPKGGNVWDILSPQETADLKWMALSNSGVSQINDAQYGSGPNPVLPDFIAPAGAKEGEVDFDRYYVNPNYTDIDDYNSFYRITRANKEGTDWFHEIFKPAQMMSHNLMVSGGSERGNYMMSLNYLDQEGVLIHTYLKRYTLRSNTQFNITDNIRIGQNLSYSFQNNPQIAPNTGENPVAYAFSIQPIIPVRDINGNFAGSYPSGMGNGWNPVAIQERTKDYTEENRRLLGNVFAEVDFSSQLKARTSFGVDINSATSGWFYYPMYENSENYTTNTYLEEARSGFSYTWTNTLTYQNQFNGIHDLSAVLGTEVHDNKTSLLGGSTQDFYVFDPAFVNLSSGSGVKDNYSFRASDGLISMFGRVDYGLMGKYLVSATLRRDGSSRFGSQRRFGWFPALSAAWRLSDEKFMEGAEWIDDFKVRGGWGIMGSQFNVNPGNAFTTFSNSDKGWAYYDIGGTSNSIVMGFIQSQIGNPDAKWENNITANVGVDVTFLGGKMELNADYYRKDVNDLLFSPELPGTIGAATPPATNIARMKNHGVDLSLTGRTNITDDLALNATLTFTSYNNKIVKIADAYNYFEDYFSVVGDNVVRNQAGSPVGAFYGYKIIGFWNSQDEIDQANQLTRERTGNPDAVYQTDAAVGRFRYADLSGRAPNGQLMDSPDNQITADDRTTLGDPNPDFSYGINIGATYKRFDFSMFFYGVQGNHLWNNVKWWTDFYASFQNSKSHTALYDSWRPDHQNAKVAIQENAGSFSTNGVPNSYYVENGSYFRAKNIQLGYTINESVLSRVGVNKLRIYVQGANLFTVTKYQGVDPEIGGSSVAFGIDDGSYPSPRQFLMGVNLTF